ncbi:MAG: hypothetical protein M0022_04325 [Desulfobacteraceae bacterium]|nr:hypothetical protein [Desulfobacteraceae bacterium]
MADIISGLISLFRIKDLTSDMGKAGAGQGGKTGLPDWASPGAEVEGVVLGESGNLDIISVGGQTIKASADAHLPVGAAVRFKVMDTSVSPIKVRLLSVANQPREEVQETQTAMSSLAVKAGIPRVSQALSSLFTVLSAGGDEGAPQQGQLQQPLGHGAQSGQEAADISGAKTARESALSLISALSYGGEPEPEKIQTLFALMQGAVKGQTQYGGITLKILIENVLDGLAVPRNLDKGPAVLPEKQQSAGAQGGSASTRPAQGPAQGQPGGGASAEKALSFDVSFETFKQAQPAKETVGAAYTQIRPEAPALSAGETMAASHGGSFSLGIAAEPSRGGQASPVHGAPGGPDAPAVPVSGQAGPDASGSSGLAVLKDVPKEAMSASGMGRGAEPAGAQAGAGPNAVLDTGVIRPPARQGPVQQTENGARVSTKEGASGEARTPLPVRTGPAPSPYERIAPRELLKTDISYQVSQQADSSHIFDAKTRNEAMESMSRGLKTLSSHIDSIQDYQSQVQARINTPFAVVPFWFENAAGFGNVSWWNEGGADKKRGTSHDQVSHLVFDMELSGLGPLMMHVTLRGKSLDLLLAARQESLPWIRSGLSELRGHIQGLGLKLEISGIIPIDEADRTDFAGPLSVGDDGAGSLHIVA